MQRIWHLFLLTFALSASAQGLEDSFESGTSSPLWNRSERVAIQATGGARGTRSFAHLPGGQQLGAKITDATGQPLTDFYIDCFFRVPGGTNQQFELRLIYPGAAEPALDLAWRATAGWGVWTEAGKSWRPGPDLGLVTQQAWHRLRLTVRHFGQTNVQCAAQLSAANQDKLITHPKCLEGLIAAETASNGADSFVFTAGAGSPGFDVDEVQVGVFLPYGGPSASGVNVSTLTGKVMCGYQGWFSAPEGTNNPWGWKHWSRRSAMPADGNATMDLWPDMSELGSDERFVTEHKLADGRPAEVFSSRKKATVVRHFQWMRDYGIDGAFVQRFVSDLHAAYGLDHCNTVLANCREGANRSGRAYAVMYDLSGLGRGRMEEVMRDWRALRQNFCITDDPAYLHHHGKPVVAVWGVGFNDNRPYTLEECVQLVRFLKSDPEVGGCTVMLGVPAYWRDLKNDALNDPVLLDVLKEADVISPWTVGRYNSPARAAQYATNTLQPDVAWCRERGIDCLPVVFPGFSWHNLQGAPINQIPRRGGQFLWSQFCGAKRAGASMIYVAMFDEIDEGTAIFKCANDVPVGKESTFLSYEGLPSDHYLKLVNKGSQLLRGEIPLTEAMPLPVQ